MQNTIPETLYHYLMFFNTKFKEKNSHYWPSTLKNAQHIFYYYLKKEKFEDIIFDIDNELEKDLNFLTQDVREELEILKEEDDWNKFPCLTNQQKSEILDNFENHVISNWHIDEIFFSCGVYCCTEQLKSQKKPSLFFYLLIYDFLLDNPLSLQFYFFLKTNNVLIQDKKEASIQLEFFLQTKSIYIEHNKKKTINFAEKFVLIWDLLEYNLSDYILYKKQFINETELNDTKTTLILSTSYCDISFIQKYILDKVYFR